MNRLSLVWSSLTSTHSILYYGHITFDLHPLPQECRWDIEQDLGIVTCNTEDLVVIGLLCVFLEVFSYSTLFQTYCPTFRACTPLVEVPYVPECPWEIHGNIRHLCELGTSSEGASICCHVECITQSILTFFPSLGQHSVNHGWLWTGEDVRLACGHRPLLHQSTVGLAQEWTSPRWCSQGLPIATKWDSVHSGFQLQQSERVCTGASKYNKVR
jgi:hypothetical protein